MPSGTITSTENTFGTVNGALSGTVAGTLTGSVGVPGPVGPVGPQGQQGIQGVPGAPGIGIPAGGMAGQFLTKTNSLDYATNWSTLSLDGYATEGWVTSQGYITNAALIPYLTISTASATYQTLAGMSAYLTTAAASSTYAVIAAGQPTSGTVGQVLTKNSGTSYDSSWQTLIPGDRYVTTSSTSLSVSNGNKSLTIGTGLAYTPNQDVTISLTSDPTLHHMHGPVVSYNSGTGALVVDVHNHMGSGTYAGWTVNVGGTVPLQTVEWGEILGTLGDQTDLATALNAKLEVTDAASTYQTIAGMSSYLTTSAANSTFLTQSDAALTYQPLSGMTDYLAKAGNLSGLTDASVARSNLALGSLAVVNDAPSDGSTYGRNNGAWVVAGGGGSYPADALTTNEVNAIADASIPNYSAGTFATLSFNAGIFNFTYLNPNPAETGGYVSFISDSAYSFTIPPATTPNWEIRFPFGTGQTAADLVSWFNTNNAAYGSISYSGSPTELIDGLAGLTSSAFVFQQQTLQAGDTFLISGYLKSYLDRMYWETAGISSMNFPALAVGYTGSVQFLDLNSYFRQTSDNTFSNLSATQINSARVYTSGSTTTAAGFRMDHGVAPTSPVNGDMWTTTSGLFYRINGVTVSPATLAGGTFTGKITAVASTASTASINIPPGSQPTSPASGDVWYDSGNVMLGVRFSTGTGFLVDTVNAQTIGGNKTFSGNCTIGNSTGTSTTGIATGSHGAGITKTVNIGTGGTVTTAITNINIGSTSVTATVNCNAFLFVRGSLATSSSFRVTSGTAPTTPTEGDIWGTGAGLFVRASTGTAMASAVRAFVSFNGSGTVATRGTPFNVSSITDNGVGNYTVNFTNAMANTNYVVIATANRTTSSTQFVGMSEGTRATGSIQVLNNYGDGALTLDTTFINVVVMA